MSGSSTGAQLPKGKAVAIRHYFGARLKPKTEECDPSGKGSKELPYLGSETPLGSRTNQQLILE